MTVTEARKDTQTRLELAGIESSEAEAWLMLSELTNLSRGELMLRGDRRLSMNEQATLAGWLERRVKREPLQHILSTAHFYGLELRVTPDVLIPRPETERLVELGLEALGGSSTPVVLDVGTGSGAIALAVKHERPDAEVWATDASPEALATARGNAERLGLDVRFIRADLLQNREVEDVAARADLLISNPPYLPETDRPTVSPEVQADPPEALFSGSDGLEHYRRLERQAFRLLRSGAVVLVELDPRNVDAAYASSGSWSERRVETDLTGRRRFLRLRR